MELPRGCHILHGAVDRVEELPVSALHKRVLRAGAPIQKQARRLQLDISEWEEVPQRLLRTLERLGFLEKRQMGKFSFLLSKKGNTRQRPHWDWEPAWCKAEVKPLGIIVALQPGTRVRVYSDQWDEEGMAVPLAPGDALIFDGDVLHAGEEYPDAANLRMHFYLDTPVSKKLWAALVQKDKNSEDHNDTWYPLVGPHSK